MFTALFRWVGLFFSAGLGGLSKGWKILLMGAFLAALGVILYNTACDFIEAVLGWISTELGGVQGFDGLSVGLGPGAAYLAVKLKFAECLSSLMMWASLKFVWKFIPFVK